MNVRELWSKLFIPVRWLFIAYALVIVALGVESRLRDGFVLLSLALLVAVWFIPVWMTVRIGQADLAADGAPEHSVAQGFAAKCLAVFVIIVPVALVASVSVMSSFGLGPSIVVGHAVLGVVALCGSLFSVLAAAMVMRTTRATIALLLGIVVVTATIIPRLPFAGIVVPWPADQAMTVVVMGLLGAVAYLAQQKGRRRGPQVAVIGLLILTVLQREFLHESPRAEQRSAEVTRAGSFDTTDVWSPDLVRMPIAVFPVRSRGDAEIEFASVSVNGASLPVHQERSDPVIRFDGLPDSIIPGFLGRGRPRMDDSVFAVARADTTFQCQEGCQVESRALIRRYEWIRVGSIPLKKGASLTAGDLSVRIDSIGRTDATRIAIRARWIDVDPREHTIHGANVFAREPLQFVAVDRARRIGVSLETGSGWTTAGTMPGGSYTLRKYGRWLQNLTPSADSLLADPAWRDGAELIILRRRLLGRERVDRVRRIRATRISQAGLGVKASRQMP
jgi:hypothetical protein